MKKTDITAPEAAATPTITHEAQDAMLVMRSGQPILIVRYLKREGGRPVGLASRAVYGAELDALLAKHGAGPASGLAAALTAAMALEAEGTGMATP